MPRMLCIGEMLIDFFPGSEESSYICKAGGAPANVAVAVSRLGVESSFCGSVGDDDFGRFLCKTLVENNVKPYMRFCKDAVTTMSFVSLNANGDRSFTFARKPGADMFLDPEQITDDMISGTDAVHAGSCSLSAQPSASATMLAL